jgi:hypothetical protein
MCCDRLVSKEVVVRQPFLFGVLQRRCGWDGRPGRKLFRITLHFCKKSKPKSLRAKLISCRTTVPW